MIDLSTVIGIYGINGIRGVGTVVVYSIDSVEGKVLAGINENAPEWCKLTNEYREESGELEQGFCLGSFFVPLSEIRRL